jgi:hypothetical protein
MNTEALKELGLDEAQIKRVMADYGKAINAEKLRADEYQSENARLTQEMEANNGKMQDAAALIEARDGIENERAALEKAFDSYKIEKEIELSELAKTSAIKLALTESGTVDLELLYSQINAEGVAFDDDGKLTGLAEQVEEMKGAKPFLFAPVKSDTEPTPKITIGGNPNPAAGKGADPFRAALDKFL